jgi:hypothetical protein
VSLPVSIPTQPPRRPPGRRHPARPEPTVTAVITACGRADLLARTLASFYAAQPSAIAEVIIIDDRPTAPPDLPHPFPLTYIARHPAAGQIPNTDAAYRLVRTPYIFHLEDDWQIDPPDFLPQAIQILETHRDIYQVWTRNHNEIRHRIETAAPSRPTLATRRNGKWFSFSFNPHVLRTLAYDAAGPYDAIARRAGHVPGPGHDLTSEILIGQHLDALGYRSAILPTGHARHIGDGRTARPPPRQPPPPDKPDNPCTERNP